MRFRLICLGLIAASCALAAPAAHAFTMEDRDSTGQYAVPKFDLDEQMKNFRKDSAGAASNGKSAFETPLGNGTLQFGVQQGPAFGPGFGPGLGLGPALRNNRQDMDRIVAPPTSLEYYGVR
jgi:hypothetical protein